MATDRIDPELPAGQWYRDTHARPAGGDPLDPGQRRSDTHASPAGVDPSPQPAMVASTPTLPSLAAVSYSLANSLLLLASDVLDDLERVRIANENRYRSLTSSDDWGKQVDPAEPAAETLRAVIDGIGDLEHNAVLSLKRTMRAHPLWGWAKDQPGVGEKTVGRLLAAIGDPYWNNVTGAPRSVSQLWAYCGYHVLPAGQCSSDTHASSAGGDPSDPGQGRRDTHMVVAGVAPSRRRGERANWNTTAKKRAFLVAEACVKAGVRKTDDCDDTDGYDIEHRHGISRWGELYLAERAKHADAVHPATCVRCGPKGKPAQKGSPLSPAHQHARALRRISKEILKELWRAARDQHEGGVGGVRPVAPVPVLPAGHTAPDTHCTLAGGDPSDPGQSRRDTHALLAGVDPSPQPATTPPTPKVAPLAAESSLPAGHRHVDTHIMPAGGDVSDEEAAA